MEGGKQGVQLSDVFVVSRARCRGFWSAGWRWVVVDERYFRCSRCTDFFDIDLSDERFGLAVMYYRWTLCAPCMDVCLATSYGPKLP
jgi:hypothetical protein